MARGEAHHFGVTTALAIGLVLAAWLVLPFPLAVLVGRSMRAADRAWRTADAADVAARSDGRARPTYAVRPMKVLVTGGAGYIGSITAKALEQAGHVPVILDSLLTGPQVFVRDRIFYEGDIADRALITRIVEEHPDLDATIHMAARIVVPESVAQPYEYYRDNVAKSLELFDQLEQLGKPRVLFSSSASLYAVPHGTDDFEVTEADPLAPGSPYARTKRMMEQVLEDMAAATELRAIILRYFNPIGSDPDLESGIYAKEPSHVLGQLVMAARGQKDAFTITGTDNPTRDGTGIRDYIHVWDLARAHVRAVEKFDEVLAAAGEPSVVINIGTGSGVTVRELIVAFEKVFGQQVPDPRGAVAARRRTRCLRQRRPRPRAARLAPRALARGGHRLGAGLGREAPGDPGLRVNLPHRAACSPRSPCLRRRVPASAAVVSSKLDQRRVEPRRRPSRGPAAGREDRSCSTPATSSATTTSPRRSTGWCRPAGSASPATPPVRRPTAATPRRRSPGTSR